MNIKNINQRQFDKTMLREGISVTDYYDVNKTYEVFFRRNNRSRRNNRNRDTQGKLNLFYAQSTPITIGTIFVLNGENYIVTSQDGIESDIYSTSIAVKCDTTFVVHSDKENKYIDVPMSVMSDEWTVSNGSVFNMVNGAVAMFTQDNPVAREIAVNNKYYAFGGYYSVGNTFYNNGLAYFYLERQAKPEDNYKTVYTGVTTLDMKESTTYQLTYVVTNNGNVVDNPSITYSSSDETVATVDENGLMTLLKEGTVNITANSCVTTMTITNTGSKVDYSISISSTTDTIKVGGSYKTLTCLFSNSDGQDITETVVVDMTTADFTWTCFIDGTEYTNDSMVVWYKGTSTNSKRIKLTSAAMSYLGHTITVKCTVNGVTAAKDLEITE